MVNDCSCFKGDLLLHHNLCDQDRKRHATRLIIDRGGLDHRVTDDRRNVNTLVIEDGINEVCHLECCT